MEEESTLAALEKQITKAKVDYLGYTTKYATTAGGDLKQKYKDKAKRRKKEWFDLCNVHCFNLIEIVKHCVSKHPELADEVDGMVKAFVEKIEAKNKRFIGGADE